MTTPLDTAALRREAEDQCVFCEIVKGSAPATLVADWDDTIAFVPLSPVCDGHILVVPKQHVAHAAQNPSITAQTMKRAATIAQAHVSVNIITSMGKAATQSVQHLHIHVVPRSESDGLMVPWGTVYGDDPTAPHWCRVADAVSDLLVEATPEYMGGTPDLFSPACADHEHETDAEGWECWAERVWAVIPRTS